MKTSTSLRGCLSGSHAVRLATTLNVVQSKLAYLESENGISRRRVRELEIELEECKRQVAKERTKVLEREQVGTQHRTGVDSRAPVQTKKAKSKGLRGLRDVVVEVEEEDADVSRYQEAVQEKKGNLNVLSMAFLCLTLL